MEEQTFWSYIGNKIILFGTLLTLISSGITYFLTHSFMKSLTIFLGITTVILLTGLWKKYNENKKAKNDYQELYKKYNTLNEEYRELNKTHIGQSKNYDRNIAELNAHKRISYMVVSLVAAERPTTSEGKRIIRTLKVSTQEIGKESDKDDV